MPDPGDPTKTAIPADHSPHDTHTGVPRPAEGGATASFHAPAGLYSDLVPHARGGLGEVFSATDAALNRTVAIKRLQDHRDFRRRMSAPVSR